MPRAPRLLRLALPTALVGALVGAPALAAAQNLSGYNVFTFGSFTSQNTDVTGTTAVGGNGTFTNMGFGTDLGGGFTDHSLVVAGTLTHTWGSVKQGDAYAGAVNPASLPVGWTVEHGTLDVGGPSPVDFAAKQTELTALSAFLGALPQTVGATITNAFGTLRFTANDPTLNVFTLDLATWNPATKFGYQFAVPVGSTVLVNVVGAIAGETRLFANTGTNVYCDALFTACPQPGDNQHPSEGITKLLYNLSGTNQTGFLVDNVHGSILAPYATITTRSGAFVGDVVAQAITNQAGQGGIEFHPGFRGNIPTPPSTVPEPATVALLGGGLAALGALARRRRR